MGLMGYMGLIIFVFLQKIFKKWKVLKLVIELTS